MATITITIPDAYTAEVADAFDARFGPRPTGVTKAAFVTDQCRRFVKQVVSENRRTQKVRESAALIATVEVDWAQ